MVIMYYVVVDIGCLECMESSNVLGIFTNVYQAMQVCDKYYKLQEQNWHGDHDFKIFEIKNLDEEIEISY